MSIICYYSLNGHTRFLAEKLSEMYLLPLFPIIDQKNRHGIKGMIRNEWDALRRNTTTISHEDISFSLSNELILIGPVWNNRLAPAIRTFLPHIPEGLNVKLICTSARTNGKGCFIEARAYRNKVEMGGCIKKKQIKDRHQLNEFLMKFSYLNQ